MGQKQKRIKLGRRTRDEIYIYIYIYIEKRDQTDSSEIPNRRETSELLACIKTTTAVTNCSVHQVKTNPLSVILSHHHHFAHHDTCLQRQQPPIQGCNWVAVQQAQSSQPPSHIVLIRRHRETSTDLERSLALEADGKGRLEVGGGGHAECHPLCSAAFVALLKAGSSCSPNTQGCAHNITSYTNTPAVHATGVD